MRVNVRTTTYFPYIWPYARLFIIRTSCMLFMARCDGERPPESFNFFQARLRAALPATCQMTREDGAIIDTRSIFYICMVDFGSIALFSLHTAVHARWSSL